MAALEPTSHKKAHQDFEYLERRHIERHKREISHREKHEIVQNLLVQFLEQGEWVKEKAERTALSNTSRCKTADDFWHKLRFES